MLCIISYIILLISLLSFEIDCVVNSPSTPPTYAPIVTVPGPRCTATGDIFPKLYNGLIANCTLACRYEVIGVGVDCWWKSGLVQPSPDASSGLIVPEWHQHSRLSVLYLTLSVIAWVPVLQWCRRHDLIVESVLIVLILTFVSHFHLCKDGLYCLLPYKLLFFGDSFVGLCGIYMAFVQSAGIRNVRGKIVVYSWMVVLGTLIGYTSVTHTHPAEMRTGTRNKENVQQYCIRHVKHFPHFSFCYVCAAFHSVVVIYTLLSGVTILLIRYLLLDRTLPKFNYSRLWLGWLCALFGMLLTGTLQSILHYPLAHGTWHISAAAGGWCTTSAVQGAGYLPTSSGIKRTIKKWWNGERKRV